MIHHPLARLEGSQVEVIAPRDKLYYFDQQTVDLAQPISPVELWQMSMQHDQPLLKLAFRIRDAISARFGVKRIGGFDRKVPTKVEVGGKLSFFLVETATDEVLSLSVRDRHLDVLTCITCGTSTDGPTATITSSVVTKNWFGKAYMIPVSVAHKVIVWNMLRRLRRDVAALPA